MYESPGQVRQPVTSCMLDLRVVYDEHMDYLVVHLTKKYKLDITLDTDNVLSLKLILAEWYYKLVLST